MHVCFTDGFYAFVLPSYAFLSVSELAIEKQPMNKL